MDKRLIEFCMRLPVDQHARDGIPRRLVRRYLASDMPEHVMPINQRGLQSADFLDHIRTNWAEVSADLRRIFHENMNNPIVDCNRALSDIDEMEEEWEKVQDFDVLRLGYTAIALEFMSKYTH